MVYASPHLEPAPPQDGNHMGKKRACLCQTRNPPYTASQGYANKNWHKTVGPLVETPRTAGQGPCENPEEHKMHLDCAPTRRGFATTPSRSKVTRLAHPPQDRGAPQPTEKRAEPKSGDGATYWT